MNYLLSLAQAEIVRLEALRFELKPSQRLVFDGVNAATTGVGLEKIWVKRNWSTLADALGLPNAKHTGQVVARLVESRVILLELDGDGVLLSVNFDFESWQVTPRCTHAVHWERQERLASVPWLQEGLWKPEQDLNCALAQTHRERFLSRWRIDAPSPILEPKSARDSQAFFSRQSGPSFELGTKLEPGALSGRGGEYVEKSQYLKGVCAPKQFRPDCGQPSRARARTVKQITETQQRTVQQLNGVLRGDESSRLLAELEIQFARVHGAEEARREMINSGGCWRLVARRWPEEFEAQIGGLKAHLDAGGNIETAAWFYFQFYFRRAVGGNSWSAVAEKARNLLHTT